jgi:hypothetical protein
MFAGDGVRLRSRQVVAYVTNRIGRFWKVAVNIDVHQARPQPVSSAGA